MSFQSDFQILHGEIKKLSKLDQHNISAADKFSTLKEQTLSVLKGLFGETSREYRVVKQTQSPLTVLKVMNHIAARPSILARDLAVNS